MILAICGLAGAGKSEVRRYFEKKGFVYVHLGVTEIVLEKYGRTNEKLERPLREKMREKHGMGVMIKIALPKIRNLLKKGKKVIIDNLYSWDEYKILKKEYPRSFFTIAVHTSTDVRHKRLKKRKFRGMDKKTAMSRDYSHIEKLDVGGPIALADFHVLNDGTVRELKKVLDNIYNTF